MTIALPDSLPSPVRLETERLVLLLPFPDDAVRLVAYYADNRRHLERWSPPRAPGFYTTEFWRWRLEKNLVEFLDASSLRLSVFERERPGGPVIAQIAFTEIVRGPLQACFLGYNIDHRFEGKGMMREALSAAIDYAFEKLKLHRICANYMPSNVRSAALLRRLGFVVEGYARDYLFIDGAWRDHVLSSRINPSSGTPGVG